MIYEQMQIKYKRQQLARLSLSIDDNRFAYCLLVEINRASSTDEGFTVEKT